MPTIKLKDGYLTLSSTTFNCPYCGKFYDDGDDKFLKRCNENKNWSARINCSCGKMFYVTYNILGEKVGYKPLKDTSEADYKVNFSKNKKNSKKSKTKEDGSKS